MSANNKLPLVAAGSVSVVLAQDRDRFARYPAYLYLLTARVISIDPIMNGKHIGTSQLIEVGS